MQIKDDIHNILVQAIIFRGGERAKEFTTLTLSTKDLIFSYLKFFFPSETDIVFVSCTHCR